MDEYYSSFSYTIVIEIRVELSFRERITNGRPDWKAD